MNETYKYFAFISFQSADAKEALWVQKAIESYRLPTAVSKQNKDLPKKMRPCFCYLNDINLSEELMQELKLRMEQSQFLIVICSPNSAKSNFVNGGIDYFIEHGGRDRIIPLIVSGTPYSNDPATECFPEALKRHFPKDADPMKDHQILGVNINEEGAGSKQWKRQRAVIMIIARMLSLEFENLWNREQKRKQRKRINIGLATIAIVAALALTWQLSKSTSVDISLQETTFNNPYLPQLQDGKIVLTLKNEQKEITELTAASNVQFKNIPRSFIGKKVNLQFTGTDYTDIDTIVTLSRSINLPISRDEEKYGRIRFAVRGVKQPQDLSLVIAGRNIKPTEQGDVNILVPIEEQQICYPIIANDILLADSICTPCGEHDVILIDNIF